MSLNEVLSSWVPEIKEGSIEKGASGGPIFSKDYDAVLGIVVGGENEYQALARAGVGGGEGTTTGSGVVLECAPLAGGTASSISIFCGGRVAWFRRKLFRFHTQISSTEILRFGRFWR